MKKLEEAATQIDNCTNPSSIPAWQPSKVIQSAKCVINLMGNLSTLDLILAVQDFEDTTKGIPSVGTLSEAVSSTCNRIRLAIHNLIEMYSQAFKVDFEVKKTVTNERKSLYLM